MCIFLKVIMLAVAIGIDYNELGQSLTQATMAPSRSATKHRHLVHDIQPSDLPEILNSYDRNSIHALAAHNLDSRKHISLAPQETFRMETMKALFVRSSTHAS